MSCESAQDQSADPKHFTLRWAVNPDIRDTWVRHYRPSPNSSLTDGQPAASFCVPRTALAAAGFKPSVGSTLSVLLFPPTSPQRIGPVARSLCFAAPAKATRVRSKIAENADHQGAPGYGENERIWPNWSQWLSGSAFRRPLRWGPFN